MGKDKMTQLQCLKEKLYKIDAELGGTAKQQKMVKGTQGEFENLFNDVKDRIFKIKSSQKAMQERAQKKGQDREYIKKENENKQEVSYCEGLLEEMGKLIVNQPDKERREKQYKAVKNELFKIMESLGITPPEEVQIEEVQVQNLQQFKANVLGAAKSGGNNQRVEANERELQALDEYEKRNKQQDERLDRIGENLDVFKGKAILMGEKQDEVIGKVKEIRTKVDKAQEQIDTSNQRLKDLLTKYRQPSKFCLDMTLLVFLLGLIAVGYTTIKGI